MGTGTEACVGLDQCLFLQLGWKPSNPDLCCGTETDKCQCPLGSTQQILKSTPPKIQGAPRIFKGAENIQPGVVAYFFNASIQKAEAGVSQ